MDCVLKISSFNNVDLSFNDVYICFDVICMNFYNSNFFQCFTEIIIKGPPLEES